MALRVLNIFDEQLQLLCSVSEVLCDVHESAACMQSLERQVAVHYAESASARGDMNRLEEYAEVARRQLDCA